MRRIINVKIAYHSIVLLISLIFVIFHLVRHQVEFFVACAISVFFAAVGLYVDIQFIRGHWRTWSYLLRRLMWLGVVGIIGSLLFMIFSVVYHITANGKPSIPPIVWLILAAHWSVILCYSTRTYYERCTDSYTLSKGSN
ncbi:hypothetical protein CSKR_109169 [Clonorchis sinensis]|uniref:Uncharacterized protein n=1 Tax=Clonorchis sinensis TaxID=79923 RepID=A0A8T1MRR0_CLOSI|nr:hypothetical protein CSKR_109169 [Clonorchis sinensis]